MRSMTVLILFSPLRAQYMQGLFSAACYEHLQDLLQL